MQQALEFETPKPILTMTISDVAKLFKVSINTIKRMCEDGIFTALQTKKNSRIRFSAEDVTAIYNKYIKGEKLC